MMDSQLAVASYPPTNDKEENTIMIDDDDRFQDEYIGKAIGDDGNNNNNNNNNNYPLATSSNGVIVIPSGDVLNPTSPTTTAIGGEEGKPDWMNSTDRTGHSYCGCCCDMRRAVIIINIISIIIAVFSAISFGILTSPKALESATEYYDDDVTVKELQELDDSLTVGVKVATYALIGFTITMFTLGIIGALRFKSWLVVFPTILYCIDVITSLLTWNIPGMVVAGLFVYPHFVFLHEMKRGSMSLERYPIEKQSCCCV